MDFLVRATSGLVRDSLPQALAMASTVPARALGLARMGTIKPGSVADLVVLGGDLRPRITLVEGRVVYQR
jgi:N-acetylglucosamine-6-phosphate deacetylase